MTPSYILMGKILSNKFLSLFLFIDLCVYSSNLHSPETQQVQVFGEAVQLPDQAVPPAPQVSATLRTAGQVNYASSLLRTQYVCIWVSEQAGGRVDEQAVGR